jgi:hypothetical protein
MLNALLPRETTPALNFSLWRPTLILRDTRPIEGRIVLAYSRLR